MQFIAIQSFLFIDAIQISRSVSMKNFKNGSSCAALFSADHFGFGNYLQL